MSRRHHGGRPHRPAGHARPADAPRGPGRAPLPALSAPATAASPADLAAPEPVDDVPLADASHPTPTAIDERPDQPVVMESAGGPPGRVATNGSAEAVSAPGCTAPQLRRFIKSRPYVPMHELRRRFGINGGEDDVTRVELSTGRIFVGLPAREGALLGELLRGGDIGYELSLDPRSPVVVGLYPIRPVARA